MFMRDVSYAADPEPVPAESRTKTLSLTFAAGGKPSWMIIEMPESRALAALAASVMRDGASTG